MKHFEDIYKDSSVLLNTLPVEEQYCLIHKSLKHIDETHIINEYLKNEKNKSIIIYGKNYRDKTIITKYNQLIKLGFINVSIYFGGMFEWLLLQEIYGTDNFKTDGTTLDILRYK